MYSMDNLLQRVKIERADELWLRVGSPAVIILDGEPRTLEGPTITAEDSQQLLRCVANTRQRRELRERGVVQFVYRFRLTDFVVRAMEDGGVVTRIDIY